MSRSFGQLKYWPTGQRIKTKSGKKSSNLSFNGQKSCTRIMLCILKLFLHFLKAKAINDCLKWHLKQFPKETQRMCANRSKMSSSVSFHLYFEFQVCHIHLKWFPLRGYLQQSHRSLQYNVNNLVTRVLSTFVTRTSGGFRLDWNITWGKKCWRTGAKLERIRRMNLVYLEK